MTKRIIAAYTDAGVKVYIYKFDSDDFVTTFSKDKALRVEDSRVEAIIRLLKRAQAGFDLYSFEAEWEPQTALHFPSEYPEPEK